MNQLYVFLLSGNSFYATGSLKVEEIDKINELSKSFLKNYFNESQETVFISFIEEVFVKYNIRLYPIKINYVFRFM